MKVVAEKVQIYLQWLLFEEWRRPQSNRLELSKETLDSDLLVSAVCVNGLGLLSISISGIQPHKRDG